MNDYLAIVMTLVASYLIGSFPPGVVYGKLFRGVDVRQGGSGRTGATNVLRTLGWKFAAAVFVTDLLKGVLPVLAARLIIGTPLAEVAAGFGTIAGHNWPVYIGFQGGRGVATSFGAFLAMAPVASLIGITVFFAVVLATRYISLGSILATISAAVVFIVMGMLGSRAPGEYYVFAIAGTALLVIRHADNIERLRAGTERKFGERGDRPVRPIAR